MPLSPVPSQVPPLPARHDADTRAAWREFVAASPHGDVLQTLEWGAVKAPEWTPIPVALEAAGRLDATALVLKRALPGGRSFFYLPRGPILDWERPDIFESMLGRLREVARAHRAVFLKIDPCVDQENASVRARLERAGFLPSPDASGAFGGTQPRCNMKLDIEAPIDQVFEAFESKWRYNTRLAQKKGVEVHSGASRDDLRIFHDIYRTTATRNEFTGRPLSYFEKMWDALEPAGMMRLFVTYHDSQPLAAAICFLLPPQCWYVYGASSNHKRNLMPNHLMQWTMIQWAKENGCRVYDFRGVPDPRAGATPSHEEGLVKFKTGFGARPICYLGEFDLPLERAGYWAWTRARPALLALARRLRNRAKR